MKNIRKQSSTFSSNWYSRYRFQYLLLTFDLILITFIGYLLMKEFATGAMAEFFYPRECVLVAMVYLFAIIFRFNLSILMYSKQKIGLYIAIFFALAASIIDLNLQYLEYSSVYFPGRSLISIWNNFVFIVPVCWHKPIAILTYIYIFYLPLIFYIVVLTFKPFTLKTTAKKFDVLTGFYSSALSEKLKLIGFIYLAIYLYLGFAVGYFQYHIHWQFLYIPLSYLILFFLLKKLRIEGIDTKTKKLIIYLFPLVNGFVVICAQTKPYLGLIALIISFCLGITLMRYIGINKLKSTFISFVVFLILPVFVMGYNPFVVPQYGVKSIYLPGKAVPAYFIIEDKEGNLGIRSRGFYYVEPKYKSVEYIGGQCKMTIRFIDHADKVHYVGRKDFLDLQPDFHYKGYDARDSEKLCFKGLFKRSTDR